MANSMRDISPDSPECILLLYVASRFVDRPQTCWQRYDGRPAVDLMGKVAVRIYNNRIHIYSKAYANRVIAGGYVKSSVSDESMADKFPEFSEGEIYHLWSDGHNGVIMDMGICCPLSDPNCLPNTINAISSLLDMEPLNGDRRLVETQEGTKARAEGTEEPT